MRTVGAPCPLRCRSSSLCTQPRRGPWGGGLWARGTLLPHCGPVRTGLPVPILLSPTSPRPLPGLRPMSGEFFGAQTLAQWRLAWASEGRGSSPPPPRPDCVWVCAGAGEPPVLLVLRLLVLALTADVRLSERRCAAPGDGTSDFVIGNGQGGIVSFAFPKVL